MAIQIYFLKRNPTVLKAERYFKERKIAYQAVDLAKHRLGMRELESIRAQLGLKGMIDEESNAWRESTARFLSSEQKVLEALAENPKLLRLPIVRSGPRATSGYAPDIWAGWI